MKAWMAAAAMAVMGTTASAATVVYTWTGTVVDGIYGNAPLGMFGGGSLAGQSVVMEFTVDTSKGSRNTSATSDSIISDGSQSLDPDAPVSGVIKLGGSEVFSNGNYASSASTSDSRLHTEIGQDVVQFTRNESGALDTYTRFTSIYIAPEEVITPTRLTTDYFTDDLGPLGDYFNSNGTFGYADFGLFDGICTDITTCSIVEGGAFFIEWDTLSAVVQPVAPVPLPASAWLLGAALAGLGIMRRRSSAPR